MIQIALAAISFQTLSITLDENYYDLAVFVSGGTTPDSQVMGMDITRNGVPIVLGQRLVPGYPVIPYRYLENGNFIITTDNDEYPSYLQFGINQFLIYASAAELAALRATF